jgi:hypothetical protein
VLARLSPPFAWLAIAVPVGISVNFIARFGVDVPYWDQWDFIPLLQHATQGGVSLPELTVQHNEHRILFPRLIMLALARLTRWDVRAEMWAGWSMLVLTGLVLFLELRRARLAPAFTTWAAVPGAWLLFTLRQWENFLWGWQLQIFLAAFSAAVALWALLRPTPARLAAGVVAAGVCSYSFASGLAVWPAGLLVLLLAPSSGRRRRLVLAGAWLAATCAVLSLYLHGFVRPGHHPNPWGVLRHPLDALGFLGAALGACLVHSPPVLALIVGCGLLLGGVVLVSQLAARPGALARARFGLGLVTFAGVVAVLITVGRLGLDPHGWLGPAMASRYATLTVLGVYGLYRSALEVEARLPRQLLSGGLVLLIAASSVAELGTEFRAGAREARRRRELRAVMLAMPAATDAQLEGLYPRADVVRERVPVLQLLGLGPFRPSVP